MTLPGKEAGNRPLPKRFYKDARAGALGDAEGGYGVLLDGRPVRTPAKSLLRLATSSLAAAVAAEWDAQTDTIDPSRMPLTRIANSAIDGVAPRRAEVEDDIVRFSGHDLICYRADAPAQLAARQCTAWDPVTVWAKKIFGVAPRVAAGITSVAQPPELADAVRRYLQTQPLFALAALHVLTTLSGSALLALALAEQALDAEAAWAAAHVDEDFQAEQWGRDGEAESRRALRHAEFEAAHRLLRLSRG